MQHSEEGRVAEGNLSIAGKTMSPEGLAGDTLYPVDPEPARG